MGSAGEPDGTARRYLRACGPATAADVRTWSRLTGLRAAIERLKPRLRTFRDERGRELLDAPDAPLPDQDTPAPPRFLPRFDNALLSHEDRTRIVSEEHRKRISAGGMGYINTFLLDGFVGGTWKADRVRGKTTLAIEPFDALSPENHKALADEGGRLVRFLAGPESPGETEVRFVP